MTTTQVTVARKMPIFWPVRVYAAESGGWNSPVRLVGDVSCADGLEALVRMTMRDDATPMADLPWYLNLTCVVIHTGPR